MTHEPERAPGGAPRPPKQTGLRGPHFAASPSAARGTGTASAASANATGSSASAPGALASPRSSALPDDQLRALSTAHATAARDIAVGLASLLRTPVELCLAEVEVAPYSELLARVSTPTCLVVGEAAPLPGPWLLEVNPSLALPLVDRLLGGAGESSTPRRALTDIESRLIGRVAALVFRQLERAWRPTMELRIEQQRIESSPRSLSAAKDSTECVLAPLEIAFGAQRGRMNLYLPLEIVSRLTSTSRASGSTAEFRPAEFADPSQMVEVVAYLAEAQITALELAQLGVGDLLMTEAFVDGPVTVTIDGARRFFAEPGVHQGDRAIKIARTVEDSA